MTRFLYATFFETEVPVDNPPTSDPHVPFEDS